MHRFYLPPESCAGNALRLDEREAHHALRVLRVQRGEPVVVLDGAGNEFSCKIESQTRDTVELRVAKKKFVPPPRCRITLLQALPKGKIIESIIQKSVELGVQRIVPLLTERVVTKLDARDAADKQEKWRQVAIEAIKQCGAAWLPKIEAPTTIEIFLARDEKWESKLQPAPTDTRKRELQPQRREKFDVSLVGSLQPERRHPRECFQEFQDKYGRLPKSVGVWIGPEGDFTLDELKAIEAGGALPVSLGRLTLRVETAAIYCLSILNYELNSAP